MTAGTQHRMIPAADKVAIRQMLDRMREAWADGDGSALASLFTEDARYVEAPGIRRTGRQAIADSHQKIFGTFFAHTRLGESYPVELQPVTPDVVLIHASGSVLFPGESEQRVPPNGLMSMVAVREGGTWRLVLFHNTPTGRARTFRFARRYLISRLSQAWAEARKARAHMLREKQENMAKWTGPENHVLNARLARGRCRPRCTTAGQRRPGWQTRLRLFHRPGFPGLGGDFDANAAPGAAA